MARLKIATVQAFNDEMEKIPVARVRLDELQQVVQETREAARTNAYQAWFVFRDACHDAIAVEDWASLGRLFAMYEGVERAGKSEMQEGIHVAFVEDLQLPDDRRSLNSVLSAMGPMLREAVGRHRRVR